MVGLVLVFLVCAVAGFMLYKKVFKRGIRAADCERAAAFPPILHPANSHPFSKHPLSTHTAPSLRWDREEASPREWQSLQNLLSAAARAQPYPSHQDSLYPDLGKERMPPAPRSNHIQRDPLPQQGPRAPLDPSQLRAF